MKIHARILVIALSFLALIADSHASFAQDKALASLFTEAGLDGTIIISSLDGSEEFVHNRQRSERRLLPASTFKILNSLIALDEDAIKDENEVIKWDGKNKGWQVWNKDQTLLSALPMSCVWFYQELAKRIGNESYLSQLKRVDYGNGKTGPDLTTFWLNGDLAISAREQIDFLKKLYKNELPYSRQHMELIKKLLIVESKPDYTIRAKTGWAMRIANQHGWYVGYVERDEETWFFATNIDIKSRQDAKFRTKITYQALKRKGII